MLQSPQAQCSSLRQFKRCPQVNSALHPSGVAKSSTSFGWGKGGKVTSAGWQVTLCDLMWHVIFRSGVVISITNCYIRFTFFTLLYFTLLANVADWCGLRRLQLNTAKPNSCGSAHLHHCAVCLSWAEPFSLVPRHCSQWSQYATLACTSTAVWVCRHMWPRWRRLASFIWDVRVRFGVCSVVMSLPMSWHIKHTASVGKFSNWSFGTENHIFLKFASIALYWWIYDWHWHNTFSNIVVFCVFSEKHAAIIKTCHYSFRFSK